jgi:hypothetical protein
MLLCKECYQYTIQHPVLYTSKSTAIIQYQIHPSALSISISMTLNFSESPKKNFVNNGHLEYCYCTRCGDGFFMKDEWPDT